MEEIYRFKTPSDNKTPAKPKEVYKFDYLKELVLSWNIDILKDLNERTALSALPMGLFVFVYPFLDPNGDEVNDVSEWSRQREEYIKKLVQEIRFKMKHGVFDQKKELEMLRYASSRCDRKEDKES